MHYKRQPLSKAEYYTLRDWIAQGAPDKNGNVMFSENPLRKKFYVTNQGCDNVSVFDDGRKVIMRVVDVGTIEQTLAAAPAGAFLPVMAGTRDDVAHVIARLSCA